MDIEKCVKKFDAIFLFLFLSCPPLYNAPLMNFGTSVSICLSPEW